MRLHDTLVIPQTKPHLENLISLLQCVRWFPQDASFEKILMNIGNFGVSLVGLQTSTLRLLHCMKTYLEQHIRLYSLDQIRDTCNRTGSNEM